MFDMGFLEFLLIGIIALIVLGPERLPKAARTVGLFIGKAKQGFESMKTEIDRELKVKELRDQLAEQKAKLEQDLDIGSEIRSAKDDLNETVNSISSGVTSLGSEYIDDKEKPSDKTIETNQPAKTSQTTETIEQSDNSDLSNHKKTE